MNGPASDGANGPRAFGARAAAALGRLWPRRLAGQLVALVLLALIAAQATGLLIFAGEHRAAIRAVERENLLERTATLVRLIENMPPALHEAVVRAASSKRVRFRLAETSGIEDDDENDEAAPLRHHLAMLLGRRDPASVRVALDADHLEDGRFDGERGDRRPLARHRRDDLPGPFDPRRLRRPPPVIAVAVALAPRRWLAAEVAGFPEPPLWAAPTLLSFGLAALGVSLVVVLAVGRLTRPLRDLAAAADRVGRGEAVAPLAEAGPADVRRTTRAFNRMQRRLQRFVDDRTRLLAAIGHDLRTPITTLRLRAEFVEDAETRAKILETLDEMQRLVEATLALAREEAACEDTRTVDLAALIDSLVADQAALGRDVAFAPAPRAPYACRPVALLRALANLIENAVAYGRRARVALADTGAHWEVTVEDDGPGIPEADMERAFQPFVRLEESRSRETGGVGLGLSIARSAVRAHGGDVSLANRAQGGLKATVRLPKAAEAAA